MSKNKDKAPDNVRKYIAKGSDNKFARVYRAMYESSMYKDLSPTAKDLFVGMIMVAGNNVEFSYPHSAYIKRMSKDTFIRGKKQLIDNGFITETHFQTQKNVYRLSDKWKSLEDQRKAFESIEKREAEREKKRLEREKNNFDGTKNGQGNG